MLNKCPNFAIPKRNNNALNERTTDKDMETKTIALSNIIDSWNMIDKFNLDWVKDDEHDTILISEEDFNMMLTSVKNPRYIQNLKASHGRLVSHNY